MDRSRPWVMTQTWHDLLFAHWPLPVETVRPLVPPQLPLDTRDGKAWIGVVPFRMSGVRVRRLPPIPGASSFLEMNLRTYVTLGGKPGVYFFSLDAESAHAVAGARIAVGLPYYWAKMSLRTSGGEIDYASVRRARGGPRAELAVRYRPTGDVARAAPGTLDHWLTERYCLYTVRRGRVSRLEIDHDPWPLRPAEAVFDRNEVAAASGIRLPEGPPLLHFAERLDVRFWSPQRVFSAGEPTSAS